MNSYSYVLHICSHPMAQPRHIHALTASPHFPAPCPCSPMPCHAVPALHCLTLPALLCSCFPCKSIDTTCRALPCLALLCPAQPAMIDTCFRCKLTDTAYLDKNAMHCAACYGRIVIAQPVVICSPWLCHVQPWQPARSFPGTNLCAAEHTEKTVQIARLD